MLYSTLESSTADIIKRHYCRIGIKLQTSIKAVIEVEFSVGNADTVGHSGGHNACKLDALPVG